MSRSTSSLLLALALSPLAGCQRPAPPPPAATAPPAAVAAPARLAELDDFQQAMTRAKAEGKALLVDAWAPWCHTCLSMQNYVLSDPSLAALADRVVLVAIDTDREKNAGFLERYKVSVWPTFYVIDPASGEVAGLWTGSASVREFRRFVEDGVSAIQDGHSTSADANSPPRLLVTAKVAQAAGDYPRAAAAYAQAVAAAESGWPRRSEALMGWLFALQQGGNTAECVRVGRAHLGDVQGAALPADFAATLLGCAGDLPTSAATDASAARGEAIARLRAITAQPPADASADDVADAWNSLSLALADSGDAVGARKAQEGRLAVLERAAAAIGDPLLAQTYDYALAGAYVALDRGDDAVAMLQKRERQLPASYEPPARLASALAKMDRLPQAVLAIERAIALAYGPRKLLYLKQKADILGRQGNSAAQVATLREEVAGFKALAKGQADPERLRDAEQRLAQASR